MERESLEGMHGVLFWVGYDFVSPIRLRRLSRLSRLSRLRRLLDVVLMKLSVPTTDTASCFVFCHDGVIWSLDHLH